MKELETLLNSLLRGGWKPWGKDVDKITIPPIEQYDEDRYLFVEVKFSSGFSRYYTRRELVSIESGLWQFVVENRMAKENDDVRIKNYRRDNECDTNCCYDDYEYRLIESVITPEEELGKFLIDNIQINECL